MKLNVGDRLIALHILPVEGDITTLRILRDLKGRLSFTEEEHKLLQFKQVPGGQSWTPEAVGDVEILMGPKALSMIAEAFERMNQAKKLTLEMLPTYEK